MTVKRDSATIVGIGAAACAVCCAGPIVGFLAAIGLGTVAGVAAFGLITVVVGAGVAILVIVRRRRIAACTPSPELSTPVELSINRRH